MLKKLIRRLQQEPDDSVETWIEAVSGAVVLTIFGYIGITIIFAVCGG